MYILKSQDGEAVIQVSSRISLEFLNEQQEETDDDSKVKQQKNHEREEEKTLCSRRQCQTLLEATLPHGGLGIRKEAEEAAS